jgi:hypothetical protein
MQVAAAQAKALADEANERHRQAEAAIGEHRRQVEATREKQAADVRRAAESAALALVEERCRQEALLAAEAEVQRRHEEVLAAEADVHRRHEEVLAAEAADVQHRHESAARDTALDAAPTLTPLAPPTAVSSFPPRPLTYVDAVLSTIGGEAPVPHLIVAPPPQPSAAGGAFQTVRHRSRPRRRTPGQRIQPRAPSPLDEVLSSPPIPTLGGGLPSCTVNTPQTVRRCYRPRRRNGRRHQPRAPNSSCDEALPSHPHPTLGGTSTPTITLPTRSARAMYLLRLVSSSIIPFSMTSSSPSSLPFIMSSLSSTNSKGRFLDFFRDDEKPVPPRKRSRRHHRSRRTGRRHGPRAPDLQEHLLSGRRHRPRAPNQSTRHGWD